MHNDITFNGPSIHSAARAVSTPLDAGACDTDSALAVLTGVQFVVGLIAVKTRFSVGVIQSQIECTRVDVFVDLEGEAAIVARILKFNNSGSAIDSIIQAR